MLHWQGRALRHFPCHGSINDTFFQAKKQASLLFCPFTRRHHHRITAKCMREQFCFFVFPHVVITTGSPLCMRDHQFCFFVLLHVVITNRSPLCMKEQFCFFVLPHVVITKGSPLCMRDHQFCFFILPHVITTDPHRYA